MLVCVVSSLTFEEAVISQILAVQARMEGYRTVCSLARYKPYNQSPSFFTFKNLLHPNPSSFHGSLLDKNR